MGHSFDVREAADDVVEQGNPWEWVGGADYWQCMYCGAVTGKCRTDKKPDPYDSDLHKRNDEDDYWVDCAWIELCQLFDKE